jgi:hypothetical protein
MLVPRTSRKFFACLGLMETMALARAWVVPGISWRKMKVNSSSL